MRRAKDAGVGKIMITAGSLEESKQAATMCQQRDACWPELFCTVGVHPTRCTEFEASGVASSASHLAELLAIGREAKKMGWCVAIGECGLDYDRLMFCPRDVQLRYFEMQLTGLAGPLGLPLFLHCRTGEAAQDLLLLLEKHRGLLANPPGVVHSFDGSP